MSEREHLGEFLRYRRILDGLTQKQMADKLGITEQYYNELETNKRKCGATLIKKIADATHTKPKHIYELWEKSEPKKNKK